MTPHPQEVESDPTILSMLDVFTFKMQSPNKARQHVRARNENSMQRRMKKE